MIHLDKHAYGICYMLICIETGKIYVGQTVDLIRRIRDYEKRRCEAQVKLYNAICDHGWASFKVEIIGVAYSATELDIIECMFIEEWDTINNGYNCKEGGSHGKLSAETRAKISASNKGKKCSPATRAKIGAANKGRKPDLKTRAKMSAAGKGKKRRPETRAKISAANRLKKCSPATRAKIGAANKGRKCSPETKAKLSVIMTDIKRSPEARAKASATSKGRKHSPETRAKLRIIASENARKKREFNQQIQQQERQTA